MTLQSTTMIIEMENSRRLENFKTEYSYLLKEFLSISKPHIGARNLETLKNDFSSIIESARTSDYIQSLEGLLRILEKRNALSHDNIQPLFHISSNHVRDPELDRTLSNYVERINNRPHLPLFNVYDLPSGKYINENLARNVKLVIIDASNNIVRYVTNHSERTNDEVTNYSINGMEIDRNTITSAEDTLINQTENFDLNIDQRTIFIAKARHCIAKHSATFFITFLGAISLVVLITLHDVKSSAPVYDATSESQDGGRSQIHEIRAQMTLFMTARPSFQLTLPGTVNVDPTGQNVERDDAEISNLVLLEVSEKLGRHWRDVARFLSVTENDIDEIDSNSQWSLKEKAFKALLKFQSKCDPLQWKSKLKRALEKARRRDLMEMVDEMLSQRHRTV